VNSQIRNPRVIVVGSGRSGTSSIGRILHEEMHIRMGRYLKPGDALNPEGYYEDLISHALIRGMVSGDNSIYNPRTYLEIMNDLNGYVAWGVKDPWFLLLPPAWQKALTPDLCMIATRSLEKTVNSWLKVWRSSVNATSADNPPKSVVDHYTRLTLDRNERANRLYDVWPNIVTIDFTERVSDEEIKTAIRAGLSAASHQK